MKWTKKMLLFLAIVSITNTYAQNTIVIPQPLQYIQGNGSYILPKHITISCPAEAKSIANEIGSTIKNIQGTSVNITNTKGQIQLQLIRNDTSIGKEGYRLVINEKGILITANTQAGLFYGWQTLVQLMPAGIYKKDAADKVTLQYVSILDKPRFAWRGLMLDVVRHFFTKEEVKKYIDDMVRYKYNVLHFHLTDDQGWRIEIKSMPKLTEVGAWRPERKGKWANTTAPSLDEPKTYGGFYTQEDIKELVAYAKSKFVEILPEIDVPGHSTAILAAYPELSTVPTNQYYVNAGQTFMDWGGLNGHVTARLENTLNPASDKVYTALDKIFGEVASLFPFEYIHMGGDECPKNNWEKSSDVKSLMQKENLKTQNEVQSYFVKKVEKIIQSKGKKLMGWDEILEGGLASNAAVMSWRGMQGGIEAAKLNHKVVMTPNDYAYIDYYQGEVSAEAKVYQGLRMKKAYDFNPLPAEIKDANLVLGGQANLWTEQIQTLRNAEYMTYPRALAIAECVWSPSTGKNWNEFVKRVELHFEKLDAAQIRYAKSMYDPIVKTTQNTKGELYATMEGEVEGLSFYYTIDESIPDNYSNAYQNAIQIPDDVLTLRIITYRNGSPIGKLLNIPIESLKTRATKVL
jgi:hexosaminidase